MAAADPALAARLAKRGLGYVTPEEGVVACESVLRGLAACGVGCGGAGMYGGCDWSTVCVSRTDWAAYVDAAPARCREGAAVFLSNCAARTTTEGAVEDGEMESNIEWCQWEEEHAEASSTIDRMIPGPVPCLSYFFNPYLIYCFQWFYFF